MSEPSFNELIHIVLFSEFPHCKLDMDFDESSHTLFLIHNVNQEKTVIIMDQE